MVTTLPWGALRPQIAANSRDGLFVLYLDGLALEVYAQHLSPEGVRPAGWPPPGLDASSAGGPQIPSFAVADGQGGAYFTWNSGYPGTTQAFVGRFGGDGTRSPGWPALGRSAQFAPPPSHYYYARLLVEDTSGVYVAWHDERFGDGLPGGLSFGVMVTRITQRGELAPGWPAGGADPCSCGMFRDQRGQGIFPGSPVGGGAVLVWNDGTSLRAQRMLRDGTRAPGWPREGVAMGLVAAPHTADPNAACSDGAGGVFAAWSDFRESPTDPNLANIYAAHTLADGRLDPRWPQTGLPVVTGPGYQQFPSLTPDGTGGFFLAWTDVPSQASAYVLRLRDDGSVHPGWPVGGALISTRPGYLNEVEIASDGVGGVWIVFENSFGHYSYMQHLGADGQPAPGWTAEGHGVSPGLDFTEEESTLTPDGQGGAYVVWSDGGILRAQHFVPDGIVPVQLALEDLQVEPGLVRLRWGAPGAGTLTGHVWRRTERTAWELLGRATLQGPDALGYDDRTASAGGRYAYQLRIAGSDGESTTAEAWATLPGAPVLALAGARPNPARASDLHVAFTLATNAPAELALFDVSGRRVAARDVGVLGAGPHTIRLAEGVRLEPGLYWLRLTQDDARATTRVVVGE